MARPKKTKGEAFVPFGVTFKPATKERLEAMMGADEEENRSRWLNDLVDEEWDRRQKRRKAFRRD
jgi:hypothetical protein